MYTENRLQEYLIAQNEAGGSLRQIATQFGPPITHADIQRGLHGEFPRGTEKRAAFGLPPVAIQVNIYILLALVVYFKPPRPRIYHRLDTMPRWALRWQLENREEIK